MPLPVNFFNHDAQAGGFFPLAHVGIDIEGIGNRQNTLIEGIRGTGKTHILKMLKRFHLENFRKRRVLPIYVSLAEISEHMKKDPDDFRVQLYARIVSATIDTIETNKDYIASEGYILQKATEAILKIFGLNDKFSNFAFQEKIEKIKATAEELIFQLSYDITAKDLKRQQSQSHSSSSELSSSVGAKGGLQAEFSVDLSAKASDIHTGTAGIEETVRILGSRLAHNNASEFIIRFLQQVQIILNLQYSLILLDECSEAGRQAQVEIFRFFKAIRGSSSLMKNRDDCAFFVGSVYPIAETYYPNREVDGFSFEPGQDCAMEFIQWDETDTETYVGFFEQMTIARAHSVLSFSGEIKDFVRSYYDEPRTFELVSYCASGIPRRFWELNKRAYDAGTDRVSYARLRIAVQEIVSEQILGHSTLVDEDQGIIQYVVKIITQKNEDTRVTNKKHGNNLLPQGIYFSILTSNSQRLKRLVMQGAIHDKSRMKSRRHSLRPHPVFALDSSIAYAFRAIPERGFEQVARKDFPRSTLNGFASAASFEPPKSKRHTDIDAEVRRASTNPAPMIGDIGVELDGAEKKDDTSPSVQMGFLKFYWHNGSGFLSVLDGGPDAFVSRRDMLDLLEKGADKGTAVEFVVEINEKGRQAHQIKVVDRSGAVRSVEQLGQVRDFVLDRLSAGSQIELSKLSNELRNYFGDALIGSGWLGFGKLSILLDALDIEGVEIDTSRPPGFLRLEAAKNDVS